jgi:uncharacterized protein (DUF433 family)
VLNRTIRGMRITVSHVLEMLAGGMTPEQVLQDFAYLEKADIDACFEHAARHANRKLYFFEAAGPNQCN